MKRKDIEKQRQLDREAKKDLDRIIENQSGGLKGLMGNMYVSMSDETLERLLGDLGYTVETSDKALEEMSGNQLKSMGNDILFDTLFELVGGDEGLKMIRPNGEDDRNMEWRR